MNKCIASGLLIAALLGCGAGTLTGCSKARPESSSSASTDDQLNHAAELLDHHPEQAHPPEDAPLLAVNEATG